METLGAFLKDKRLKSNKSLEDIAQETKIRKGLLEAIENDQYELLPPRAYFRGLLRTYAREIGIDPDEVLDKYEAGTADHAGAGKAADLGKSPARFRMRFYVPICVIVCIIAVVYFVMVNRGLQRALTPPAITPPLAPQEQTSTTILSSLVTTIQTPVTVQQELTSSAVTTVVTTVASTTTIRAEIPAAASGTFTVRFEADALTWVRIQADQEKNVDILLSPGQSYKHSAMQTMKVRLGNAGGVALFYNDTPLGKPGKSGQIADLKFPEAASSTQRLQDKSPESSQD